MTDSHLFSKFLCDLLEDPSVQRISFIRGTVYDHVIVKRGDEEVSFLHDAETKSIVQIEDSDEINPQAVSERAKDKKSSC
jgi:hypothetical protein